LYSSLIVTWSPPIQDGVADTDTALSAARTMVVSCMAPIVIELRGKVQLWCMGLEMERVGIVVI
jgi:hypothetical protein